MYFRLIFPISRTDSIHARTRCVYQIPTYPTIIILYLAVFFIQMSWYAHFGEPSFSVKRLKHEIIHHGREVQVYSFTYQLWSYYYLCNTFLKNSQYSRRLQWFYGARHAMTFRPAIVITFLVRTK